MIPTAISEVLRDVDRHMDNISNLLPGLPDDKAEDFLKQVQNAEESLEAASNYLVR
jgi:hypothetical protein